MNLLVPLSLFGAIYLAIFVVAAWWVPWQQWDALVAVVVATATVVVLHEGGRWRVGLAAPPLVAIRDLAFGAGFAVVLIGVCDILIMASTDLRHVPGGGFPWSELLLVYAPAAVHEELLFRGYPYQKVRSLNRSAAIVFSATVFAALHRGNSGFNAIAVVNLVLAGILLALAYEVHQQLWLPIGIHAAWNILSGPILGYNVSGYVSRHTVFAIRGGGPQWLTGGRFGIEASVWMVVVEIVGIAVLIRSSKRT